MKLLFTIFLLVTTELAFAKGDHYRIEYDYTDHGDDWYGHSQVSKQQVDYAEFTDIETQRGDDFCQGYEPTIVHYLQTPELIRTQESHSSYDFKYSGGTRCLSGTPPQTGSDLIFANGFE